MLKISFCLALLCLGQPLLAEEAKPGYSLQLPQRRLVEHLEHTVYLLQGPDGGVAGVALRLRNLSESENVTLERQEDGNIPLVIHVMNQGREILTQRMMTSVSGGKFSEGKPRLVHWTLKPGESRWFLLTLRHLFVPLPSWERVVGCSIHVSTSRIEPPAVILAAARNRKLTRDTVDMEARMPGIDVPFASSLFRGVTLTQGSLQADAEKAFAEARRNLEGQENHGAKK